MKREALAEARLAWSIYQMLEELNRLLWDRYEDEFLAFATEEDEELASALQEQPLEPGGSSSLGGHDPLGSEFSQPSRPSSFASER